MLRADKKTRFFCVFLRFFTFFSLSFFFFTFLFFSFFAPHSLRQGKLRVGYACAKWKRIQDGID